MLNYLKNSVWDFVLCVVAAAALSYTACSAFYSAQPYQSVLGVVAMVVISAVVEAALFLTSTSRRARVLGAVGIAVVVIVVLAVAFATSTSSTVLDDTAGNNVYFALCVLVPPLLVYPLSRRRWSTVVLIIVGIFFCAVIEYLYWYGHVIAFILFIASSVTLFIYRTYQRSLLNSESETLAFNSVTAAGVGLSIAAVLLATGIFALVVAPLNPPNLVVKLITENYRVQTEDVRGVGSSTDTENLNEYSNKMSNKTSETSNISGTETNKQTNDQTNKGNTSQQDVTNMTVNLGSSQNNQSQNGNLGINFPNWLPLVIAIIVILLIVGSILLKKYLRKRRFNKLTAGDNNDSADALYLFFLSRFQKFRVPQPGTLTLSEYGKAYSDTFTEFESMAEGPTFASLSDIYSANVYGKKDLTDEQISAFKEYYRSFYKRAARYIGRIKYALLYFFRV